MRRVTFSERFAKLEWPCPGGMATLSWERRESCARLTVTLPYTGAYGMGERYNALNQKGRTVVNQVEENSASKGKDLLSSTVLLDGYRLWPVCGNR